MFELLSPEFFSQKYPQGALAEIDIGKRERESTEGPALVQTIQVTLHSEITSLAEIFKTGRGTAETFGAGHLANDLFDHPAIFVTQSRPFSAQLFSPLPTRLIQTKKSPAVRKTTFSPLEISLGDRTTGRTEQMWTKTKELPSEGQGHFQPLPIGRSTGTGMQAGHR
jgi:hypothetical protein